MSELNTPDSGTVEVSIPEDFSAYENFRRTGELPAVEEPSEVQTDESETGTVSDSETDSDQESAEESKPERDENGQFRKKQRGIDKRFHELTSEIRGLKEQLASRADTSVASSRVEPEAPQGEPQPEQYDDYNQYIRDLAKWSIKSESEAAERFELNRRQQVAAQTAAEAWQTREKALKAKHADYEDAIQSFKIPETPAVAEVRDFLGESEKGPELLYFLAKNPAEAERIVKLSPRRAVAEMGKLEEKLTPQQKQAKAVTNAPAPPQVVGGKSSPSVKPLRDVTDFSEYEARRKKGEKV